MKKNAPIKHIVFDHDGTLVDVEHGGKLFNGIETLLERLSDSGVKLYVWTARTRYSTVEFLKSLGIISRFEQLSCSTDCEPKPCVAGLEDMLFDADPSSVAVVGDSFADMIGAKNYGAFAIGALWADGEESGRRKRAEILKEYGADFLAETVDDCAGKILKMIN